MSPNIAFAFSAVSAAGAAVGKAVAISMGPLLVGSTGASCGLASIDSGSITGAGGIATASTGAGSSGAGCASDDSGAATGAGTGTAIAGISMAGVSIIAAAGAGSSGAVTSGIVTAGVAATGGATNVASAPLASGIIAGRPRFLGAGVSAISLPLLHHVAVQQLACDCRYCKCLFVQRGKNTPRFGAPQRCLT